MGQFVPADSVSGQMGEGASGWQNFYLMAGGATAVLTGLVFVVRQRHGAAHDPTRDNPLLTRELAL